MKYPLEAQKNSVQASVIALVKVDKSGNVKGVKIAQNSVEDAVKIDEVVIVAYKSSENTQNNSQAGLRSLEKETKRILKSLPRVTNQNWIGKQLEFQLKFRLE